MTAKDGRYILADQREMAGRAMSSVAAMGSNPTVTAMKAPEKSGVFPYPTAACDQTVRVSPTGHFPRASARSASEFGVQPNQPSSAGITLQSPQAKTVFAA